MSDALSTFRPPPPSSKPSSSPSELDAASPPAAVAALHAALSSPPSPLLASPLHDPTLLPALALGMAHGVWAPDSVYPALVASRPLSSDLLLRLVLNVPWSLKSALSAAATARHAPGVHALLALRPQNVQFVLAVLMGERETHHPAAVIMALDLVATHGQECLVEVVEGLLVDPHWVPEYVASVDDESIHALVDRLLQAKAYPTAVKLMIALSGLGRAHPSQTHAAVVLDAMATHPIESVSFTRLCLCFLLAIPSLVPLIGDEAPIHAALDKLKAAPGGTDLLLLIAIHIHAGTYRAVADTVRRLLGMAVALHNESLFSIARLITSSDQMEEAAVAQCAPQLDASAVDCVFHLLSGGVLAKHKVDITPWVWNVVTAASDPVDPEVISLVAALIKASAPKVHNPMTRFPEADVLDAFSSHTPGSRVAPPLLLLTYYVLECNYQDLVSKPVITSGSYSMSVLDSIPVQDIWDQMSSSTTVFGDPDVPVRVMLEPMLTRVLFTHYPHLFTFSQLRTALYHHPSPPIRGLGESSSKGDDVDQDWTSVLEAALGENDMGMVAVSLSRLRLQGPARGFDALPLLVSKVVEADVALHLPQGASRSLYALLWDLIQVDAWRVVTRLALAFQDDPRLDPEALKHDPHVFLRVPREALVRGPLIRILLHGLDMGLAASSGAVFQARSGTREEMATLVLAQESAAVLMVLEILQEACEKGAHETMRVICQFIHQRFIENVLLAKLVHFQMYPLAVIPVLMDGVPSMHVCSTFVSEMLDAPYAALVRFAIFLTTSLVERYPLPRTAQLAEQAKKRAAVVFGEGDAELQECLVRLEDQLPYLKL